MVIEPRPGIGRGGAYRATELGHTLNGNAARMSVDPDDPDEQHDLNGYRQIANFVKEQGAAKLVTLDSAMNELVCQFPCNLQRGTANVWR